MAWLLKAIRRGLKPLRKSRETNLDLRQKRMDAGFVCKG